MTLGPQTPTYHFLPPFKQYCFSVESHLKGKRFAFYVDKYGVVQCPWYFGHHLMDF